MPTRIATSSPTRDSESVGTKSDPDFSLHPARNWDGSRWNDALSKSAPRLHPERITGRSAARAASAPAGEEHGVAVAEEAVARAHRVAVGGEDPLRPAERADQ